MDETAVFTLADSLIAMALGLLLHIAMKWGESRTLAAERGDFPLGAIGYVKSVPAQTTIAVLSGFAVFWVGYKMGWMNPLSGFAAGYIGNSIAENLANRFRQNTGL